MNNNDIARLWACKDAKSEAEAFEKAILLSTPKKKKQEEKPIVKAETDPHDVSGLIDDYCP